MMAIIQSILAIFSNIPFVIKFIEKSLGTNWYKKQTELDNAYLALKSAKTQGESDAALKQISIDFSSD